MGGAQNSVYYLNSERGGTTLNHWKWGREKPYEESYGPDVQGGKTQNRGKEDLQKRLASIVTKVLELSEQV